MGVPLFPFDDSIRQLYQDGIDTIIFYLGRPCRFVMPGPRAQCPNCLFDPVAMRSSGVYNGSGPRPFNRPPCPVCNRSGYDPATEDVARVATLSIDRTIVPNRVFPPGFVTTPGAIVKVKGTVDLIPYVQTCRHAILDFENAKYSVEKYILLAGTKPKLSGSIVAGRYFTAFMQQVE